MSAPRLRSIRLTYGCHDRQFQIPDEGRPVVIAGPNGSGKTSLLEALLRTLYGFSRRKPEERRRLEMRKPWSGKPTRAEIEIVSACGHPIVVSRDFGSDEVVAVRLDTEVEVFRGDANPVGVRSENRHYRELLSEWMGFATLEPYRKTAWIGQGELVDTELDNELLRAAAGTHKKVESALGELRESFDGLTREAIVLGGKRKTRPRTLEELRTEADVVSGRLDTARAARERRRPLRDAAARTSERMKETDADLALLEAALRPLSERRTLVAEEGLARDRLQALSEALEWVTEAERAVEAAAGEAEAARIEGVYPEDFESRVGQLEILWQRADTLERELEVADRAETDAGGSSGYGWLRSRWGLAGGALLLAAAALAMVSSAGVAAAVGFCGVLLVAIARWTARGDRAAAEAAAHADRLRSERIGVEEQISALQAGVPGPPLREESAGLHRQRSRRHRTARETLDSANQRLAEAVARADRSLPDPTNDPAPDVAVVKRRLTREAEEARTALARAQLRLEEQPAAPELPEGVEPTVPAVDAMRAALRAERDELAEERAHLDLELRDMERASEDALTLERELGRLRDHISEVEAEVSVTRQAWELVRDAYAAFRDRDQERLLHAVNARLSELSRGELGPIEAEGELATARIQTRGHTVVLDSPPLSFGEKHVALLAIRLGAADFLAGDGVLHPLLVDEPFAHLDEHRSAEVWDLLCATAARRQVIITTQDRLTLDHLGITPDVQLARAEAADRQADDALENPTAGLTVAPGDGKVEPAEGRAPRDATPQMEAGPDGTQQAQLELG